MPAVLIKPFSHVIKCSVAEQATSKRRGQSPGIFYEESALFK